MILPAGDVFRANTSNQGSWFLYLNALYPFNYKWDTSKAFSWAQHKLSAILYTGGLVSTCNGSFLMRQSKPVTDDFGRR